MPRKKRRDSCIMPAAVCPRAKQPLKYQELLITFTPRPLNTRWATSARECYITRVPERKTPGGRQLPGAAPESERRKAEASTQLLGYMLGNALYEAYLKGRVTRAMLRR